MRRIPFSSRLPLFGVVCCALSNPLISFAFDEFSDLNSPKNFELRARHLTLVLKGEIELELHDLEGAGGPGFDSVTDTRTLGTRSPFVEIDSFSLAPRFVFSDEVAVNSVLEFTTRGALVSAVWFDARLGGFAGLDHHLGIGYHTPFVKIDRRTERYPLIATIYWRQPEIHAVYEGLWTPSKELALELGLSAALMRPIDFASIQEASSHRGTINVVSYGSARPFSGNAPVWGAKLVAKAFGIHASVFGFVGRLASEAGTDALRNNFGNYGALGDDSEALDRSFHWYGGRLGFDAHGIHFLVEAIRSKESLLARSGAYAQASYQWSPSETKVLFHTFEPILRGEVYRIKDAVKLRDGRALRSPAPSQALTWDHDILTAGLLIGVYRDLVRARLEYAWIRESNGVPALGVPENPIKNDELLLQLELRF